MAEKGMIELEQQESKWVFSKKGRQWSFDHRREWTGSKAGGREWGMFGGVGIRVCGESEGAGSSRVGCAPIINKSCRRLQLL